MPIPTVSNSSVTVNYNSLNNIVGPNVTSGTYDSINVTSGPSNGSQSNNNVNIFYTPSQGFYGTDYISYTVHNTSGTSAVATITINVAAGSLTASPTTGALTAAVIQTPYAGVTFTASGGYGNKTATKTSGVFPPGLTLSSNNLTGTPTGITGGNYSFAIRVTDQSFPTPLSVTTNYTLTVGLPSITLTLNQDVVAEGGKVYLRWSVPTLSNAIVNLVSSSGALNLQAQPLNGYVAFTAPAVDTVDTITATLRQLVGLNYQTITTNTIQYRVDAILTPVESGKLASSKVVQTSKLWDKTPVNVPPHIDWDQWGLYRAYIGSAIGGWGSDGIQHTEGTVELPYSGQNVDVVVISDGAVSTTHPEFSVNKDGSGGSRVKYYNWLQWTSEVSNNLIPDGIYSDRSYRTKQSNKATAVASVVAGNTYGWARGANIYSLDYTATPWLYDSISPIVPEDLRLLWRQRDAFEYVNKFHVNKGINQFTGVKNPTIVIVAKLHPHVIDTVAGVSAVNYTGTGHTGPFTTSTLETYLINQPYVGAGNQKIYVPRRLGLLDDSVANCITSGVIIVAPAGNDEAFIDVSTGSNWNNTISDALYTTYYNRGQSPSAVSGVICVGAASSAKVESVASYSNVGPRVDLFAPGDNVMVAFNSKDGIFNNVINETPPTVTDPRNSLFSIGKDSGTEYAAAQVAGFLACLAQVQPSMSPSEALGYVTSNAAVNQLTTSTTSTVALASSILYPSRNGAYSDFMNTYGVWPTQDLSTLGPYTVTFTFNAPYSGSDYKVYAAADNLMTFTLAGVQKTVENNFQVWEPFIPQTQFTYSIPAGRNVLTCTVTNYHGPGAFAVRILDGFNNQIFATSSKITVAAPDTLKGSPNLYLFGTFPNIQERVYSIPSVANNQTFNITINGGTPNGAYNYRINNFSTGTGFLDDIGSASLIDQMFDTAGTKTYDFSFINTTDRVQHTIEVIDHNESLISSSFTQSGTHWNKTPQYIVPETNWLNWGLLRSSTSTNVKNWGSDSDIVDVSGTVTVPYAGLNVDIVIIDSGGVDPDHPEFALYSDGTGGSRVQNYNWLQWTNALGLGANGNYDDANSYKTEGSNRAVAMASIAAGNTYGWARAANIYSLNYSLLPGGTLDQAFQYVTEFHNYKLANINADTGFANPTLVIVPYTNSATVDPTQITSVTYQGNTVTGPFTTNQLIQYGILEPFVSTGNTATVVVTRYPSFDTEVTNAINAGVIVVGTAGDQAAYVDVASGANYDNHFVAGGTTYYYHRGPTPGAVPGVICVGAIDSTVQQQKATYSGNGPRVDLFAPGSDQISAVSSVLGLYSDVTGMNSPTYTDPRNPNFYIGKGVGTAYAAANAAGYLACLLQVYPQSTPTEALALLNQYATNDGITIDLVGFGVNNDLNGAPNKLLYAGFPDYNEQIYTSVNGSSSTAVVVGDNFDIYITNGDPDTKYHYSGTESGTGTLDANGNAHIATLALKNTGLYVYKFRFASTNHIKTLSFQVSTSAHLNNKNIIYANDYDRIQNRINYLMKTVYGTATASAQRQPGVLITATDWLHVYSDIQKSYIHQNGDLAGFNLDYPLVGNRVTSVEINSMTDIIDNLINNAGDVATNQLVLNHTYNITTTTTAVFDSYIQQYNWAAQSPFLEPARNFFNLGGYVEVSFENPTLGRQTGAFTLTDYISSYGYISLPIPGGFVNSTLSTDSVNGNVVTIDTIVAPDLGATALATGTVKVYASTAALGGIAAPTPSYAQPVFKQGQLNAVPIRYISIYGNAVTTSTFTLYNTFGSDITVEKLNLIPDPNRAHLGYSLNTRLPFTVPSNGSVNVSISFQNVEVGGSPGLYQNRIDVISDGPNPLLKIPVPVEANFGIVVVPNPYSTTVTRPSTSTFAVVPYAGEFESYTVLADTPATGFQVINPGVNYTYFTLDDTPGKVSMNQLIFYNLFQGLRAPSTIGAVKSPYEKPILIVDTGAIPNLTTSTQLQFIAYPKDPTQAVAKETVDVSILVDVEDRHLGSWLSPQNQLNGVFGFSYDIINGLRCLTVGFGMGGGATLEIYKSDHAYGRLNKDWAIMGFGVYSNFALPQLGRKFLQPLTTATALASAVNWYQNINTTTYYISDYSPQTLVTLNTNSNYFNPFLQTYGVWNGNAIGEQHYDSTSTFMVRDGGTYSYYFNCNAFTRTDTGDPQRPYSLDPSTASATFKIDGVTIASTDQATTNTEGTFVLDPGYHTVSINATQDGGEFGGGAVALAIVNDAGYTVWCTLDGLPPSWAEIGRIILTDDGHPHTYDVVPNVYSFNKANNTTYANYFQNSSMVTVNDNGTGQLTITLNHVVSNSNDAITDATLANVPYLFYYYSNSENQTEGNKRFTVYDAKGQYTRYFTGFDPYGNVTTKLVLAPGYIAPPPIILANYTSGGKHRPLWETVLIDIVKVVLIAYAIFAIYTAYCIIVGGLTSGVYLWSTAAFSWAEFVDFVVYIGELIGCFTGDTEVLMADGTVKKIKDIKPGEYVFNHDRTQINKVKYLEITVIEELTGLYSPSKDIAPFATLNHPLFIDGKLSSVFPEQNYEWYPWLGMTNKLVPERSGPMQPGSLMYNLYLDGDNTYTVNGYGTHSIFGDGGALRVAMEHDLMTQQRVQEMMVEYTDEGIEVAYGSFLFNAYYGKVLEFLKIKKLVTVSAELFDQPKDSKFRQRMNKIFKFIGKCALKIQKLRAKK